MPECCRWSGKYKSPACQYVLLVFGQLPDQVVDHPRAHSHLHHHDDQCVFHQVDKEGDEDDVDQYDDDDDDRDDNHHDKDEQDEDDDDVGLAEVERNRRTSDLNREKSVNNF